MVRCPKCSYENQSDGRRKYCEHCGFQYKRDDAAELLAATRQILAEYKSDAVLQIQAQAIDRFLASVSGGQNQEVSNEENSV